MEYRESWHASVLWSTVWQAATITSSPFGGQNRDGHEKSLFKKVLSRLRKERLDERNYAASKRKDLYRPPEAYAAVTNHQGNESTILERILPRWQGNEGGKNGRRQGAVQALMTRMSDLLSDWRGFTGWAGIKGVRGTEEEGTIFLQAWSVAKKKWSNFQTFKEGTNLYCYLVFSGDLGDLQRRWPRSIKSLQTGR